MTMRVRCEVHRACMRAVLVLVTALLAPCAAAADVLVFAASSLKPALDAIIATPEAKAIGRVTASYAASSQLARQIEHGAPAAIFVSADREWMDHVEQRGLVVAGTRIDLLGNALVLVAPATGSTRLAIAPGFDLRAALGADGRLAIGEPGSVPAGRYAKSALVTLGAWPTIASRTVSADNVRGALNFVVRGEAPLGIVYRSDAVSEPAVRIVGTFPADSHPPIIYPLAVIRAGESRAAHALADLLRGPSAQARFVRFGFSAVPR